MTFRLESLELRVQPLALLAITAASMWALAQCVSPLGCALAVRLTLAAALGIGGLAVILAGVTEFKRAQTTLLPQYPDRASRVVSSGVYRYTRNPMYLGALLILLGWGAWLENLGSLALAAVFVAYMTRFQIVPEERAMARNFGADYESYRRDVRRWL